MKERVSTLTKVSQVHTAGERLTLAGKDYQVDQDIKRAVVGALAAARKEGGAKIRKKYSELETELRLKAKTVATLQSQLSENERARLETAEQLVQQSEQEKVELKQKVITVQKQAERIMQLFYDAKINCDLCFALKEYELFSLEQTINLIRSSNDARVIEVNNEYKTVFYQVTDGESSIMNSDEFVASFMAQPQNSILVKNKLCEEKNRKKVAS